ncbi:MAG: corrinoid protein [Chloroflexota bacterium]
MTEDLLGAMKENVIQGRITKDDEGLEDEMTGQPGVKELVQEALDNNYEPRTIIDTITDAMSIVGDKFESKEFFIPDMLAAAETVGVAMEMLEPLLAQSGIKPKGKVLLATVKGDLHDIGKNIVSILLRGNGYIVNDLGNDISAETIANAVKEEKPMVLGLSALLTSTMGNMKDVIEALKQDGTRDQVKVVIGGAPITDEFAKSIGADGYGADGFDAVRAVDSLAS